MKVKQLIKRLERYGQDEEVAYTLWLFGDVVEMCLDLGVPIPSFNQGDEILRRFDNLSCDGGQCWESLEYITKQVLSENAIINNLTTTHQ